MTRALELAAEAAQTDEVPVGAVIVKDGVIIAEGKNHKESSQTATGHAEIAALNAASEAIGAWRLEGCDLYVTLEPCVMCSGAIVASRIRKVIYGAKDPKGGAVESLYQILDDSRLNHSCEVVSGVLQQECSKILKDFFKEKRNSK